MVIADTDLALLGIAAVENFGIPHFSPPRPFIFGRSLLVAEGVLHGRDEVLRQQGGGQQQQKYHEATLD